MSTTRAAIHIYNNNNRKGRAKQPAQTPPPACGVGLTSKATGPTDVISALDGSASEVAKATARYKQLPKVRDAIKKNKHLTVTPAKFVENAGAPYFAADRRALFPGDPDDNVLYTWRMVLTKPDFKEKVAKATTAHRVRRGEIPYRQARDALVAYVNRHRAVVASTSGGFERAGTLHNPAKQEHLLLLIAEYKDTRSALRLSRGKGKPHFRGERAPPPGRKLIAEPTPRKDWGLRVQETEQWMRDNGIALEEVDDDWSDADLDWDESEEAFNDRMEEEEFIRTGIIPTEWGFDNAQLISNLMSQRDDILSGRKKFLE